MATLQEQIDYYVQLLIIQFKTLPNATGTIRALTTEAVADQIFSQVLNGFDLSTAVGAQLNTLAQYVGAPRTIYAYDPTVPYFAFQGYSDTLLPNVGFASYSDTTDPIDFWLSYTTGETSFILSDGQLRSLISYMIAVHKSNTTLASIDDILQTFFGTYCTLADNEDMTVTYTHQTSDPNLLFSIVNQLGLLPQPAGVQVQVVEV